MSGPARQGRLWEWLKNEDLRLLLASLVLAGGAWFFWITADQFGSTETMSLDERLLLALRSPGDAANPAGPPWLAEVVRDVTALGSITVLMLLSAAVMGFLLLRGQTHGALLLLGALLGGLVLVAFLKELFGRPRPDLVPHLHRVTSLSFPSGHAFLAAVVYLTLSALLARLVAERRAKIYLIAVAGVVVLLVGASRVYLGVHYPSDVLAGWAAGLVWATTCWLAGRALQRRGMVEQAK